MQLLKLTAVGLLTLSPLTITPALHAQETVEAAPASAQRQAEIKKLIADLSSPDEVVRTSAMQKLVTMGADAQQALQDHIRSRDAAQEALAQIEVNKVAGPTMVTLELKDAPITDAIAQLAKQTGYKIQPYNDNSFDQANLPNITLSAKDKPFWEVMREIMAQGEVAVYESGNNDNVMRLMPVRNMGRSSINAPYVINGAFMVTATSINRSNSVDLANPENINRSMQMQFQVMAEPKVNILRYSYQPEIEIAVDDQQNNLANSSNNSGGYSSGRNTTWSMSSQLNYPAENPGTKIAKLKGKMKMTVQTRSETLEVTDLDNVKDKTEKVGGRRITVISAKRSNENQYEVKLAVYRDGMDQQAFYDWMNNAQGLRLLDKDGNAWRSGGGGSSGSNDRYELTRTFYNNQGGPNDKAGDPVKLVWEIPTGTQEITIPFEFNDLPMP